MPIPEERRRGNGKTSEHHRCTPEQPQEYRCLDPIGTFRVYHRGLRLGQIDADGRDPVQGACARTEPRPHHPRRPRYNRRGGQSGQDHQYRPVAHRSHATLQSRHLYRAFRPHPLAVRRIAGEQGARLQAWALLLQRARRALRGLPGSGAVAHRNAVPAGCIRAMRRVPRGTFQPRDPAGSLQGSQYRRGARPDRRTAPSSSSRPSHP